MEKTKYNPDALEQVLDEFDFTSSNLALFPTLENAQNANIASLNWADLLYNLKRENNQKIPQELGTEYLSNISACLGILTRIREKYKRKEKNQETPKKLKKPYQRKDSDHLYSFITQMRGRIILVQDLMDIHSD